MSIKIPDDDHQLLKDQMQGVKPLSPSPEKVPVARTHRKPPNQNRLRNATTHGSQYRADDYTTQTYPDIPSWRQHGVREKQFKMLMRGKIPRCEACDLHGLTRIQAHEAVPLFLQQAQRNRWPCVLMIHGKGYNSGELGPVIKNWLTQYLQGCPEVLAFCAALPRDGGKGALYVLLRTAQ